MSAIQVPSETVASLLKSVQSLETQVLELKSKVQDLADCRSHRSFGDMYGVLAGQLNLEEDEIDAAKYRFDWQKWESLHRDDSAK